MITRALDSEKVEANLDSLLQICKVGSTEYWNVLAMKAGIHEGKYDIAESDMEVIPMSEKLDDLKAIVERIESHFA
jgi:hypothetical protein